MCGRARQGKSFILNQLAGAAASNDAGFKVGPTVKPCTKGLWIWSAPIPTRSSDGQAYHLILLDTEGIDAYDQTGQYSTQIFSMAVLLSSLFVYNQMGGIDEAALDRLSLVTEMTKHIRVRSDEGRRTREDLRRRARPVLSQLRLAASRLLPGPRGQRRGRRALALDHARGVPGARAARRRPGRARRGGEERDSRLHQGSVPRARVFPARAPGERRASVAQLGHHAAIGVATGVHRRFRAIDRHALLAVRAETHRGRRRDGPGARVARRGVRGGAQRRRRARHRQRVAERRGGGVPQSRGRGARGVRRGVPRGVYRRRRRRRRRRARARRAPPRASSSTPARSAPRGPVRGATRSMRWTPNSRDAKKRSWRNDAPSARLCARRVSPPRARGSAPSPTPPTPPPTTSSPPPTPRRRPSPPTPGSARGATRSSWRGCGTSR